MNKVILFILLAYFICIGSLSYASQANVSLGERPYIDIYQISDEDMEQGRIWVKFDIDYEDYLERVEISVDENGVVNTGISSFDKLNTKYGVYYMSKLFDSPVLKNGYEWRHQVWGFHLWYELRYESKEDIRKIILAYRDLKNIISWSEPEYKKELLPESDSILRWTPNDPQLGNQWHYNNTGQSGGTPGADISLFDAWDIEKGHPHVIVAVIDSGVQYDHPDLAGNMWSGTGYNFVNNTSTIFPGNHGTHVAGTVAAVTNNNVGVAGVAGGSGTNNGVRIMSCQVFTDSSQGGFHLAPIYAADNNAAISQNSWGYTSQGTYNQAVLDAIDYFNVNGGGNVLNGGITIFAAGNSNTTGQWYPGCYSGAFSVAATNNQDQKAWYSTYDSWVDISAPGGETNQISSRGVLSTRINNNYGYAQGTSMACPHASGVAALLISYAYRNGLILDNSNVADLLRDTTDDHYHLNPGFIGQLGTGRLNAHAALIELHDNYLGVKNPQNFAAIIYAQDQINLTWQRNEDNDDVMIAWSLGNTFGIPEPGVFYSIGQYIPGGGVVIYRGSGTTFEHTDLQSGTNHYYRAFSYNIENDYSIGVNAEAMTPPGTILNEDFNASTSLPENWDIIDHQGNGQVWQFGTINNGLSGTTGNYAYLNSNSFGNQGSQNSDLITPIVNLTAFDEVEIEFTHYYRHSPGSLATFSYSIDDGVSWIMIDSWNSNTSNPAYYNQLLSFLTGESQVRFKWNYTGSNGWYWCIDDVMVSGEIVELEPPTDLIAEVGNGFVQINWTAPILSTPQGYNVYRNNVKINPELLLDTEYEDNEVINDLTYLYFVTAVYGGIESNPSNMVEATPAIPYLNPPYNLIAIAGENIVRLEWGEPSSLGLELLGYNVYRDGEVVNILPVEENYFEDETVDLNQTYQYRVTTVYSEGESVFSNTIYVTIEGPITNPPVNLNAEIVGNNSVMLNWDEPELARWVHWDDGVKTFAVGTNAQVEFKAAARFSPDHLSVLGAVGEQLTKVRFFPNEVNCIYTINVWLGGTATEPGELIVEQLVENPQIGYWNIVDLDNPVLIQSEAELWIGYNIDTQFGYPAGCDSGPASNGVGNMMYFNGQWSTLKTIAPTLDYNWNLQGYVTNSVGMNLLTLDYSNLDKVSSNHYDQFTDFENWHVSYRGASLNTAIGLDSRTLTGYVVYRNGIIIGETTVGVTHYLDEDLEFEVYQYYVTALYEDIESEPSNMIETSLIPLSPPENLVINIENGLIELSWDPVATATHYIVEAASGINEHFVDVSSDQGVFDEDNDRISWSVELDENETQLFYRVRAIR